MSINLNSVLNTLAAKAKALALNVTETELKVLEATNEEPWGPHGKDMQEIARTAEDPEKYNLIMNVISERLQMRDENWRLCYKALLLLEYLVKHGPWRVVDELNRSVSSLERLRDEFEYKDAQGRDQGINVRQRAGELASLVCNIDRVRQEREKAARNANKFKGVSSSDVRGFGGFGSNSYSGGGGYGSGGFGVGGSSGFGGGGSSGFGGGGSSGFGGGGSSGFGGGGRSGFGGGGSSGFGGNWSQGFGSTESNHVPSSPLQARTGLGSNLPGGAASSGRREDGGLRSGEDAEDPFEATRKRIERLKTEGALQDAPPVGPPPGLVDAAALNAKAPKKLSDVKINPAVAATFANISIPSSTSGGNLVKLAPPPPPGVSVKPLIQQHPSGSASLDLFADHPSDMDQGSSAAASGLDWDVAFGSGPQNGSTTLVPATITAPAAATVAASDDPFADFTSAAPVVPAVVTAPAASTTAATGGFHSLFVGGVSGGSNASASGVSVGAAAAASSKPSVREPLPFDAFSELGEPSPAVPPVTVVLSASAVAPAPSVALAANPFVSLTSSSSTSAPPMAGFRPNPAAAPPAAAVPFAALSTSRTTAPAITVPSPAKLAPAPVASAPLHFDAFGLSASQPAWTLPVPPAAAAAPAASDPFAALASSSMPAPVPMAAAAATRLVTHQPQHAASSAIEFDPFSSAPVAAARQAATTAGATFDAFGSMAAAAPPQPAVPAPGGFDDLFGTSSPGHNGNFVSAPKPPPVSGSSSDPFAAASFQSFSLPPPLASAAAPAAAAAASQVTAMAMNKTGAALGAAGHKNHDPFAGLGF